MRHYFSKSMILFLTVSILSTCIWITSFWHWAAANYHSATTTTIAFAKGRFIFIGGGSRDPNTHLDHGTVDSAFSLEILQPAKYQFAGFAFDPDIDSYWLGHYAVTVIPLWFPTTLSALALLWSWRRHRRSDPLNRQGFPIEKAPSEM